MHFNRTISEGKEGYEKEDKERKKYKASWRCVSN